MKPVAVVWDLARPHGREDLQAILTLLHHLLPNRNLLKMRLDRRHPAPSGSLLLSQSIHNNSAPSQLVTVRH